MDGYETRDRPEVGHMADMKMVLTRHRHDDTTMFTVVMAVDW